MTAEIVEISRDELGYRHSGRQLAVFVEWGTALIVYGTAARWDDGTPLTDDELRAAQATLERTADARGWELDLVTDFVRDARIRRLAEPTQNLGPGRVRDTTNGAELTLAGDQVGYRLGDRTATLSVRRDPAAMSVALPSDTRWDGGEPFTDPERTEAAQALARAGAFWGWWAQGAGNEPQP